MDWTRLQGRTVFAMVLVAVGAVVALRLSSFGIWDPWELASADLARQVAIGEQGPIERPPLTPWLIAQGFAIFGIHEWSGRLPMAIAGLVAVIFAYVVAARFAGRRAGVWAALIAGTSPLFVFNARQMLGTAPAFAASAAVFTCALAAAFAPARITRSSSMRWLATFGWLFGLLVSIALAIATSGALTGAAPPLLGAGVAIVARGELLPPWRDRRRVIACAIVLAITAVVAIGAAHAVWADYAGFGFWTGGTPRGGQPPTWEVALERIFHSFAPWSGLLPIALARMLMPPPRTAGASRLALSLPSAIRDPSVRHPDESALRIGVVGWAAFGFLAQTIFTARYGPANFLPLVGIAVATALLVRDVERVPNARWALAIVAFFLVGLVIRDFRAYPIGPIEGIAADGIEMPEIFKPDPTHPEDQRRYAMMIWGAWAGALLLFGAFAALGLAADARKDAYPDLKKDLASLRSMWRAAFDRCRKIAARITTSRVPQLALSFLFFCVIALPILMIVSALLPGIPRRLVAEQGRRGVGFVLWIILFAIALTAVTLFGLLCVSALLEIDGELLLPALGRWLEGGMNMTSAAVRYGRLAALTVPALVLAIACARYLLMLFSLLRSYRLAPAMIASLGVAAWASFGFLPELSSHFSPREVYDTYNRLARDNEPLGEFRVGSRAAAYYATGSIRELDTQAELLEFLHQERRVWAAFRTDDLAAIDREYRRREGRHLFVADARSARMLLATNRAVRGIDNENYLADAVLDEPPRPQHRVDINFDNRVQLIGYDLELPQRTYVGPGEAFRIIWYFRVNAPVPGNYQPFVHIDGPGQRINGDHVPVEGRYPMRLWTPGDIIVDRQELRVPLNYARGTLTIFMGFYSGEQRLEVVSGPEDDVNRARVGIIPVR
jgi:4-amino-4-deoxy-L-arabinose transferase-like glycosyltransferase